MSYIMKGFSIIMASRHWGQPLGSLYAGGVRIMFGQDSSSFGGNSPLLDWELGMDIVCLSQLFFRLEVLV